MIHLKKNLLNKIEMYKNIKSHWNKVAYVNSWGSRAGGREDQPNTNKKQTSQPNSTTLENITDLREEKL